MVLAEARFTLAEGTPPMEPTFVDFALFMSKNRNKNQYELPFNFDAEGLPCFNANKVEMDVV